jgi:hypothetical protein
MINDKSINQITEFVEEHFWPPLNSGCRFASGTPLFNYIQTEFNLEALKMFIDSGANVNQ